MKEILEKRLEELEFKYAIAMTEKAKRDLLRSIKLHKYLLGIKDEEKPKG